jgi:hypothetical protein
MRTPDETSQGKRPVAESRTWAAGDDQPAPPPLEAKAEGRLRTFLRRLAMLATLDPRGGGTR